MDSMPAQGGPAPLSPSRLEAVLITPESFWTAVEVLGQTGSTNADALTRARAGAPEGLVIAAEEQTAGRGRQGRTWQSTPGAALTFSVLLRPASVPPSARGWIPLLAGVATASALRAAAGVQASLKWPNDVVVDGRKLAGILAEQSGDAIVVGIGLNVTGRAADLPVPTATSLEQEGATELDRNALLPEILRSLAGWYLGWSGPGAGDPEQAGLRAAYLDLCATLGREIKVELPGAQTIHGTAADIDAFGRLIIETADGQRQALTAGDVIHVR
jgi:BirA family biotin operon repressor/biotin-[acetyl-CoA-carboxylase] ligase